MSLPIAAIYCIDATRSLFTQPLATEATDAGVARPWILHHEFEDPAEWPLEWCITQSATRNMIYCVEPGLAELDCDTWLFDSLAVEPVETRGEEFAPTRSREGLDWWELEYVELPWPA